MSQEYYTARQMGHAMVGDKRKEIDYTCGK